MIHQYISRNSLNVDANTLQEGLLQDWFRFFRRTLFAIDISRIFTGHLRVSVFCRKDAWKEQFQTKIFRHADESNEINTSQYNYSKNSCLSTPFCFRSRRLSTQYPVAPRPFQAVSPRTLSSFHRSITPIGMAPDINRSSWYVGMWRLYLGSKHS